MDVGERSQCAVRPDNVHFGMPSLFRISSLVHVMPASKSAIPSSTRSRSTTSRAKSDHVASSGSSSMRRRASSLMGVVSGINVCGCRCRTVQRDAYWRTSRNLGETLHVLDMKPRMKRLQLFSRIDELAVGAKRLVFADDPIETKAARRWRLGKGRAEFPLESVEFAAR